jgi:Flp pilus assembly protein TadD
MAEVLIQLGDLATARRFAIQALENNPDYAAAHMHLGLIYVLQGDRENGYQQLVLASSLAEEGLTDQIQRLLDYHFPQDQ